MPKPPERIRSGQSSFFQHRPDLYAVRQAGTERPDAAVSVVPDDAQGAFAVYNDQPPKGARASDLVPVYSAGQDGPVAVPTGRVLVRLAEGKRPEDHRASFEAAGFDIERTLSYAPTAAWLRPRDGGVAEALEGLAALERLPDVVHVEPQVLLERAFKGG